ncbi:MAG TPA: proline--tRNA ligase [Tissierellia bacterium]|nr:proline--tRNA ligase [Tissierellia bacterium]
MRLKDNYFFTIREHVKDEDSNSGNLLVRAGYIKKSSSGHYMLLPLGLKTIRKIERIIREEIDQTGAQELMMPAMMPEEVYIDSGRREAFGSSMFSLTDRNKRRMVLGPTHEEMFAAAGRMHIKSYKDLPFALYQFQTKFRDEPRPRFGLIRVREFTMKDSYTYDKDLAGLDVAYQKQFQAYKRIFDRLGLEYVIVRADTGAMGGLLSEEFQALSSIGEDILVMHEASGYAQNIEVAKCVPSQEPSQEEKLEKELVHTPGARTIEEVVEFLGLTPKQFVKSLIYLVDGKPVCLCVRGDHEINEIKVLKLLGGFEIEMAPAHIVEEVTGAAVGFAGPLGLDIPTILDQEVPLFRNVVTGANQTDYHYRNVNLEDMKYDQVADIRLIEEGDMCENGAGPVIFKRGIEVGNTFKLGDKYSIAMDLYYTDQSGKQVPVMMGSYGIGPGRCMAAIVEQNHEDNAILWPKNIAPIQVAIVVINMKNEDQVALGEKLYGELRARGIDVVLDDRDERAGVKFNDMELVGAYLRITVGKNIEQGVLELKEIGHDKEEVAIDDIVAVIEQKLA